MRYRTQENAVRAKQIVKLHKQGFTFAELAMIYDITPVYAFQIWKRATEKRNH
jgi:hypothetical protein